MVSRSLALLALIVGACDGLTKARLRQSLGVKKANFPLGFRRARVQLLDDENQHNGTDDDEIDWMLECPGVNDIHTHMNVSGCLDDGTPLGDNFNETSAAAMNATEFCNSCNPTEMYDMVMALDVGCFNNSRALPELNVILPVMAAMCTTNDAGELCVADFFLEMFLDDDDDDDSYSDSGSPNDEGQHRDPISSTEGSNSTVPPGPSPGPGPSMPGEHNHTGSGEAEWTPWWESVCEVDLCPWEENMIAHQFDCDADTDLFALKTLCIRDQGRMCVDPVISFLESGNMYGVPTQYDHQHFCEDPCSGAVIQDMRANGVHEPMCMSGDEAPMDLSLACFQNNGSYCLPLIYEGMMNAPADEPFGLNCTFDDPANTTAWGACDLACGESAAVMFEEYGCCADVYMEMLVGDSNVDAAYTWVEDECRISRPAAELCSEQFAPPRDTPQCVELRDSGVDVLEALKCLVHLHEGI